MLTPHHLDSTKIILVPRDLHGNVPHIGSASDMRRGKSC
ncbi:HNH endonuclease [Pantoea ananatis]|nr:HNH endonuclease [Pantoea ananatis]UYL03889.1 HNH endonuclease [Pantoea ananatis]